MADKPDTVKVFLKGSFGIGGVYYGPGLVDVPRAVAEIIAVNAGKSMEQLEEDAAPYVEAAAQAQAEADAPKSDASAMGDTPPLRPATPPHAASRGVTTPKGKL